MEPTQQTARITGILFIIASAMTVVGGLFFFTIYDPAYLTLMAANTPQVLLGVLLALVAVGALVAIPIVLYPVLKIQDETLALGYFGARIFEGVFFALSSVTVLATLSLSQAYVAASAPATTYLETLGPLFLAVFDWTSMLLDIPFALSAIILNYLFYQARLIPRWLSGWGLLGGLAMLPLTPLHMFTHHPMLTILAAPIGIQEMALAVWLLIKGFAPPPQSTL